MSAAAGSSSRARWITSAIDVSGPRLPRRRRSTGGFTDCLLQRGAARVWAIDVGHGQLDWKLRNDPRVVVREGVNARYLAAEDFPEKFDLAVCDASFISATLLIPAIVPLLAGTGEMIILVKPQFEVGKGEVGKGGIVRDPALHRAACDRVRAVRGSARLPTDYHREPHSRGRRATGSSCFMPADRHERIVKSVGLIAKPRSERRRRLVPELIAWLEARGIAVFAG